MTTEDKIQIHVVHSVKGGCGKTAFSLFRALELSSECRKSQMENSNIEYGNQVPVIWLDADFKGSASRVLFYAETQQEDVYKRQGKERAEKTQEKCDKLSSRFLELQESHRKYEAEQIMDAYIKSGKSLNEMMTFLGV